MSGQALATILSNYKIHSEFAKLVFKCKGAVVYRCLPDVKANIVAFVNRWAKFGLGKGTMAVGDALNDVSMM